MDDKPFRPALTDTSVKLIDTLDEYRSWDQVNWDPKDRNTGYSLFPVSDATNPPDPAGPNGKKFAATAYPFFKSLKICALAFLESDPASQNGTRVSGTELSSFDTHNSQGSTAGTQATLLSWLAYGIALADGVAYVAGRSAGLRIIDATDGRGPVLAGTYVTRGSARGVFVADGYAYVAEDFMGIEILDVSRKEAPVLVQNFSTPGAAEVVALAGETLFVADGFSGLLEIDVRDPARPVLAGAYDTPGVAAAVAVASGLVFVADGSHGLQIVRPNPPVPEPARVSGSILNVTLPAGFTPGPCDVQLTGPDGATVLLPDGFLVCGSLALAARLARAGSPDPPARPQAGAVALDRLELGGDDALFAPRARRHARLLLPALPARVEARYSPGTARIELRIGPSPGVATTLVSGPAVQEAAREWEGIRAAGGIDLGSLDDRTYDVLRLSVLADAGGPAGPPGGRGSRDPGPPLGYRYAFEAGRLVEARAWGPGGSLVFDVSATDPDGCEAGSRVIFDGR